MQDALSFFPSPNPAMDEFLCGEFLDQNHSLLPSPGLSFHSRENLGSSNSQNKWSKGYASVCFHGNAWWISFKHMAGSLLTTEAEEQPHTVSAFATKYFD